ncbi:hypothetical protein [Umezawaea sp.]|uniref:hypothetical protein n=1 Tax=Umezawaea sp. TaxID=1955258 RepID=UPI002ED4ACAD
MLDQFRSRVSALAWKPSRGRTSTRARLQALIDRLDLPPDWTIAEFIASIEHLRGRRIVPLPLPLTAPVELCGLWLACQDHDVIFLRRSSDSGVELHVALHEVGHMLLGHGQDTSLVTEEWAALTTGLALGHGTDPTTVRARGVSNYASTEEYEAELLATLISFRARTGPRRNPMLKEL